MIQSRCPALTLAVGALRELSSVQISLALPRITEAPPYITKIYPHATLHDKDSIRNIERYIAQIQPHTTNISSVPPYIAHDVVPSDCSSIGSRPVRCKTECVFEMATITNKKLSEISPPGMNYLGSAWSRT